ncbi:phosphoglucomutase-like protein [Ascobolus immersus RN42]|uniref:Phosphoglucomutase-like protein n=1 Tax=Ascobolus immersus RN42 TaxID=1160509 RepID=A0A3N4IBU8_ASCIM|nr:phosphoglucomutase-like protein [Ascobolus immersus RN42]
MPTLDELAVKWLEMDKNARTRQEIMELVKAGNTKELELRLGSRIAFGTAGLRASMEAGFSRMNDLIIIQATQGLCQYVISQFPETAFSRGVVIGYDHRHNSERFARLAASAFIVQGVKVHFYDQRVHTPMVPFGIKQLNAVAGVMITASHNPAKDNGYKVYWENACQIIPPHDKGIAASIEKNLEPVCWDADLVDDEDAEGSVSRPLEEIRKKYLEELKKIHEGVPQTDLKFVYTPMHGVGLSIMKEAARGMGLLEKMVVVEEQARPDPDFPTVKFPNPEEKGALDLAMATADEKNIPYVLASDPDADRFAFAEKVNGTWRVLTGNQLGVLFGAYVLENYKGTDKSKLAMLCSTVSTQMLSAMAETEGFKFEETLTGFKWLGNQALRLQSEGFDAEYAFEEAIGYMQTEIVPDKDGISAAVAFLSLLRNLASRPEPLTPSQYLETLYEKYGFFENANAYLVSPSPDHTAKVFGEIRALGGEAAYPQTLGSRKVLKWRDLTVGYDSSTPDNKPTLPVDPSAQMITVELEGNVRFTVRGSGTEPKIKFYVECKAGSREEAKKGAEEVAKDLKEEWFRPQETGLIVP